MTQDQYNALKDRMRYLLLRAGIKDQIGWESAYEHREREALDAALAFIAFYQPHLEKIEHKDEPAPSKRPHDYEEIFRREMDDPRFPR